MPSKKKNKCSKKIYGKLNEDDDELLKCFICSAQENWQEHKRKPEHQSKLQFFDKSFTDISENNVRCKVCKSSVPKSVFQKHAGTKHKLMPWYRPKDEFTTLFKNRITNIGDEYYCHLCENTHHFWYESIKHTEDSSHLKIWNKFTRLNDLNTPELTEEISEKFVTNEIISLSGSQLRCWPCNCIINGFENASKHIISEDHKNNLLKKKERMSGICSSVSTVLSVDQFVTYFDNFIMKRHNDYYCNLCNNNYLLLSQILNHIEEPEHKNLLSRKRQLHSIGTAPCKPNICELLVKNNIFQSTNQQLECYSCRVIISSYSSLDEHLNSNNHKISLGFVSAINISLPLQNNDSVSSNNNDDDTVKNWIQSESTENNSMDDFIRKIPDGYYCHLCNARFSTSSEVMTHLNQREHMDLKVVEEVSQIVINENPAPVNYLEDHVKCKLCNIDIPKNSAVEHAITNHPSIPWIKPDNEYITYFKNFITPKNNYYCYVCNKSNKRWYLALEHTKSVRHLSTVDMFINQEDVNEEALSLKQCEKYVNNSIFPFTLTQLRCWKCNYVIDGYENVDKHINSDNHKKVVKNINSLISTSLVPDKIVCNDSSMIFGDSINSIGDKEPVESEIKTNTSTDQLNFSDSLEKSINESKVSLSSGYASTHTDSTIINDTDDDIELNLNQSTKSEQTKFLILFENFIGRYKNVFYCNLCYLHFSSEDKALAHINKSQHQNLKKVKFEENVIRIKTKYSSEAFERFVDNFIFSRKKNVLMCIICDSTIRYNEGEIHINSTSHCKKWLNKFDRYLSCKFNISAGTEIVPEIKHEDNDNPEVFKEQSNNSLVETEDQLITYFKNYISKRDKDYYCYLCNKTFALPSLVMEHIARPLHYNLSILRITDENIDKVLEASILSELFIKYDIFPSKNKLKCFKCNCKMLTCEEAVLHIEDKHVINAMNTGVPEKKSLSDLENLYIDYFENCIFTWNNYYYCSLCKVSFLTEQKIMEHLKESFHDNQLDLRKRYINFEGQLPFLPNTYEKLVRNNIFHKNSSSLFCFSCQCDVGQFKTAEEHIDDINHSSSFTHVFIFIDETCTLKPDELIPPALPETKDHFAVYFENFIEKCREGYCCHLCEVRLSNLCDVGAHINDPSHNKLKSRMKKTIKQSHSLGFYEMCVRNAAFLKKSYQLKCYACDSAIGFRVLEIHIANRKHKVKLQLLSKSVRFKPAVTWEMVTEGVAKKTPALNNKTEGSDSTCNKLQASNHWNDNIVSENTSNHKFNLEAFKVNEDDSKSKISDISHELPSKSVNLIIKCFNNYIYMGAEDYFCNLCKSILSSQQVTAHIEHTDHQVLVKRKKKNKNITDIPVCMLEILEKYVKDNVFQVDSNSLYCFACDCPVAVLKEHINIEEHTNKLEKFILEISKSTSTQDTTVTDFSESEVDYHQYFENCIFKDRLDYFCHVCFKSLNSALSVNTHIDDETHKNKMAEKHEDINIMIDIPSVPDVYQKLVRNNIMLHDSENLKCHTCHYLLPSFIDAQLHIESRVHQQKHGIVVIESSKKSQVLNISQTDTKPLISLRPSGVESKEKVTTGNVLTHGIFFYNDAKKNMVQCVVCNQKLQSRVFFHIHLTGHFWQLFTDKNIRELMAYVNLNAVNNPVINNVENSMGYNHSLDWMERRRTFAKSQSMLPNNSGNNAAVSPQLWVNDTKKELYDYKDEIPREGKEDDDLTYYDIDEDETPKPFDIYKIDEELQYTNQLSLNRICIVNKDQLYCMVCRKTISNSVRIAYEHFRSIEHSYFLMQMIQDHTKFEDFTNELSDLDLAREFMEDRNDRHAVCYVCDPADPVIVPNTNEALKNHINQHRHLKSKCELSSSLKQFKADFNSRLERSWSNTHRYWCVICSDQFRLEKSFYNHLNSKNHNKKCYKFAATEKFIFDFCPTCGLLFYGFKNTLIYHSECKFHQYYADRTFYSITRLPTAVEDLLVNAEKVITSKMEELEMEKSFMEHEEKTLINDLKNTIGYYVKAQIYPFGSRVSGLGSTNSDFDLFLDCDNLYYNGTLKTDTSVFLREVEHALKQDENLWMIQRTVLDCRVPIITVTHQTTRINCDLSFTNGLTSENTKLVKSYIDKFPLCKKLILFLKDWLNTGNLGGEDGISSYAISWMVIYYLQTKFILPNVATLIKLEGKSRVIGGWETGASSDFAVTNSVYSFEELLKGFFIMCAGFDYRNKLICPLLGRPVKKLDMIKPAKLTNLPKEMETYKFYVVQNKKAQRFSLDSAIAVQDPYDLSNNLTKAVKKCTMNRFRYYCTFSSQILAS